MRRTKLLGRVQRHSAVRCGCEVGVGELRVCAVLGGGVGLWRAWRFGVCDSG